MTRQWGRLVRWYERRNPVDRDRVRDPDDRMAFFWRLCWWLKGHGFIARPTDHPGYYADYYRNWWWQWAFWRGPYYYVDTMPLPTRAGLLPFWRSVRVTLWLLTGWRRLERSVHW